MKKVLVGMFALVMCAGMAMAHTYKYSECTVGHTFSCGKSDCTIARTDSKRGACPSCTKCKDESKYYNKFNDEAKEEFNKQCNPFLINNN